MSDWDEGGKAWPRLRPPLDDLRVDFRNGFWMMPPGGEPIRIKRVGGTWVAPAGREAMPLSGDMAEAVEEAFRSYLKHRNPKRAKCPKCESKLYCRGCDGN